MKVLIVYHSEHHGNTKKLVEAIAGQGDVTLLNASENSNLNWSDYDLIGFASGIFYQKFHKDILDSAEKNLPIGKKVFFLYTCGVKRNSYTIATRTKITHFVLFCFSQLTDLKLTDSLFIYVPSPFRMTFILYKIITYLSEK